MMAGDGIIALLVFVDGASSVICAIAVAMILFGLSGSANVCMSLTTSIFGRAGFQTACTPIQVIFNVLSFAGISVMSTVSALFGAASVTLAASLVCCVAFIPIAMLSYRQIASKIRSDEEVAFSSK